MTGLVPFLTSLLARKRLLLRVHVQQQVSNTVAVAKLIVIPRWRKKQNKKKREKQKVHESQMEGFVDDDHHTDKND